MRELEVRNSGHLKLGWKERKAFIEEELDRQVAGGPAFSGGLAPAGAAFVPVLELGKGAGFGPAFEVRAPGFSVRTRNHPARNQPSTLWHPAIAHVVS
jgi:hypothetical protein